jgi:hypothetical protein
MLTGTVQTLNATNAPALVGVPDRVKTRRL